MSEFEVAFRAAFYTAKVMRLAMSVGAGKAAIVLKKKAVTRPLKAETRLTRLQKVGEVPQNP